MSGVSCFSWIGKGVVKEKTHKIQLGQKEKEDLIGTPGHLLKSDSIPVYSGKLHSIKSEDNDSDIERFYELDCYNEPLDTTEISSSFTLAGLTCYASNHDDPYITSKYNDEDEIDEDSSIHPGDNLLLIGKSNEHFSSVEVHVFNQEDNHSFCHHEILINSYPLALEWLDYDPEFPEVEGNFFALGTMLPVIEIWDLDLVDAPEPVYTLGNDETKSKKRQKGKVHSFGICMKNEVPTQSHTDAIMGLSWNQAMRSVLASASADSTARIWDLSELKCLLILQHPDKVQTIQWHPSNPALLATGCFDGIIRLYNCESGNLMKHWKLTGEIEKILWNPSNIDYLLASTDDMKVVCLNTTSDEVLFTINTHTEAITDISLSCEVPGLLLTCSMDDTVKLWDIEGNHPVFLYSQKCHMDGILCSKFCVDDPYTIAIGGHENGFQLLNILSCSSLKDRCKQKGLIVPSRTMNPTYRDEYPEDEDSDGLKDLLPKQCSSFEASTKKRKMTNKTEHMSTKKVKVQKKKKPVMTKRRNKKTYNTK